MTQEKRVRLEGRGGKLEGNQKVPCPNGCGHSCKAKRLNKHLLICKPAER
jgi:hypothetical protein